MLREIEARMLENCYPRQEIPAEKADPNWTSYPGLPNPRIRSHRLLHLSGHIRPAILLCIVAVSPMAARALVALMHVRALTLGNP